MNSSAPRLDMPIQDHTLSGKLYKFHGFRVVDSNGELVGRIDWIWSNDSGQAEHFGVNLRWLRGTAKVIPAPGARIDTETSTIHVAFTKRQIRQAHRFSIDRILTAGRKLAVAVHYASTNQTKGYGTRVRTHSRATLFSSPARRSVV